MAQLFNNFSDAYSAMQQPSSTLQKTYDSGSNTGVQPIADTSGPGSQVDNVSAPQATSTQAQAQGSSFSGSVAPQHSTSTSINTGSFQVPQIDNSPYKDLFKPIAQSLQKNQDQLNQSAQQFTQGAGQFRDYGSIGGQQTLQNAINTPSTDIAGHQQAIASAKSLLGSAYAGPQNLQASDLASIGAATSDLNAQAPLLTKSLGAQNLIQQAHQGLSPAALARESKMTLANPEYQQAARGFSNATQGLYGNFLRAQNQAQDIAVQRTAQEKDIADQSKNFLSGQQNTEMQTIQNQVAQAQQQEDATNAAYNQFMQGGDVSALGGLTAAQRASYTPEGSFDAQTWTPEQLNTPERQMSTEADKAYQGIVGNDKYAMIKDVPGMTLSTNKQGREVMSFPQEWWDAHAKDYTKAQQAQIKDLAKQRQDELVKAGFSEGTRANPTVGKYSQYDPLYFGNKLELPDLRGYASLQTGALPTIENMSTADQKKHVNNINEMLDQAERIGEADPWQGSQIAINAIKANEDVHTALTAQKGTLDKNQKQWFAQVDKARKRYKDSNSLLNKAFRAVSNTLSSTLGKVPVVGGMTNSLAQTALKMPIQMAKMGTSLMPVGKQIANQGLPTLTTAPPRQNYKPAV